MLSDKENVTSGASARICSIVRKFEISNEKKGIRIQKKGENLGGSDITCIVYRKHNVLI